MARVRRGGVRDSTIVMKGLDEVVEALAAIGKEGPRAIRKALTPASRLVATEARARAPRSRHARGPHMADTIRTSVRGGRDTPAAFVTVGARRVSPKHPRGYPYPRRIEFEGGTRTRGRVGAGSGPRGFLFPALADKAEAAAKVIFDGVEAVIDKHWRD